MIRDLTDIAIKMVTDEEKQTVRTKAEDLAEERMLDLLLPPATGSSSTPDPIRAARRREKLRKLLREGRLDERFVDIEVTSKNFPIQVFSPSGTRGDGRKHIGHAREPVPEENEEEEGQGSRMRWKSSSRKKRRSSSTWTTSSKWRSTGSSSRG